MLQPMGKRRRSPSTGGEWRNRKKIAEPFDNVIGYDLLFIMKARKKTERPYLGIGGVQELGGKDERREKLKRLSVL